MLKDLHLQKWFSPFSFIKVLLHGTNSLCAVIFGHTNYQRPTHIVYEYVLQLFTLSGEVRTSDGSYVVAYFEAGYG